MNAASIYRVLAILLGYSLIISGFLVFGKSLEDNVKVLDIVVSCSVFTQFAQFIVFRLVRLNKSEHKEVGMMGIHIATLTSFCALALIWMLVGILYDIKFKYQLMGQLFILFIMIVGRFLTLHAGEKVTQVYVNEQQVMFGKTTLRKEMDDFIYGDAFNKLRPDIQQHLLDMQESLRFISPSANNEAKVIETLFIQALVDLKAMMRDVSLNEEKIVGQVERLELMISRRKKY